MRSVRPRPLGRALEPGLRLMHASRKLISPSPSSSSGMTPFMNATMSASRLYSRWKVARPVSLLVSYRMVSNTASESGGSRDISDKGSTAVLTASMVYSRTVGYRLIGMKVHVGVIMCYNESIQGQNMNCMARLYADRIRTVEMKS